MFKTLKSKISLIYICLVAVIVLIGTMAALNLFALSQDINDLVTDNYSSITALSGMLEAIERQDSAILLFITSDKQKGLEMFNNNIVEFRKCHKIASGNITFEQQAAAQSLLLNYNQYISLFSEIRSIRENNGINRSIEFYNTDMIPVYNKIKDEFSQISSVNERSLFQRKLKANNTVQNSMYIIILVSAIGAIGGLFSSRYFTTKLLRPIYELTDSIKKVGEGDVGYEINVSSKDEIGILANEFNKMLERLRSYQQNNLGKLMTEKNKSLAILKSISEPILILDISYRILLINKACEEFFNISEWKVANRNVNEVIKNDELLSHISSALSEKEPSKEKIIPFKCTDEDFYFNVIVTKIREDSNKHLKSFVVVFHDVTRLKYLEKVRTDFIATISHEFKTPLTSILMGTSLLRDESVGYLNERQKKIIDTVCEDGERLTALVNNLLHLSRLESGKEVYNFEPTSVNDVVEIALKSVNSLVEQSGIKVYSHLKKNLPYVKADPEKITWVINNLLTNALKYTKPDDEIHLQAYVRDDEVFLSVRDTGTGIPEEYLNKIFDKYVQVKGYGIEVRGNGLGLAIVKDIIKAHGGSIWCESKPNKGSNFIFSLPIYK